MPPLLSRLHRFFCLAALIFLIGCAGPQLTPETKSPTVTPTPGSSAQPGVSPVAGTATATQETRPSETPVSGILLRIKNAASGSYLYEKDGILMGEVGKEESVNVVQLPARIKYEYLTYIFVNPDTKK